MYFFDTDGQRIDSSPMRRPSAAQYR